MIYTPALNVKVETHHLNNLLNYFLARDPLFDNGKEQKGWNIF